MLQQTVCKRVDNISFGARATLPVAHIELRDLWHELPYPCPSALQLHEDVVANSYSCASCKLKLHFPAFEVDAFVMRDFMSFPMTLLDG